MCFGSKQQTQQQQMVPTPPPLPAPPPLSAAQAPATDQQASYAANQTKRRLRGANTANQTLLSTNPTGMSTGSSLATKTLLGQ